MGGPLRSLSAAYQQRATTIPRPTGFSIDAAALIMEGQTLPTLGVVELRRLLRESRLTWDPEPLSYRKSRRAQGRHIGQRPGKAWWTIAKALADAIGLKLQRGQQYCPGRGA
jgi:hypothetical protein